jgi:glycosyltransferase involved in cell wall biosynthesis
MPDTLTLSVGIAAYNAEKNIRPMLAALLAQRQEVYVLQKIDVHSDASSDGTVAAAASFADPRIKIIDNKARKGFAGSLISLLKNNKSDIIVSLNDDIQITDPDFLNKIARAFIGDPKTGLACGDPLPFRKGNFIQRAVSSSFWSWHLAALEENKGNNAHTCNGKILALSSDLISALQFPEDLGLMGNVDAYLYFACLKAGFNYRFVKGAEVYYPNPSTIRDYVKSVSRNNDNFAPLAAAFGRQTVLSEPALPKAKLLKYKFAEFIKNPAGSLFIFFLGIYIALKLKLFPKPFNPLWETVATTKNI